MFYRFSYLYGYTLRLVTKRLLSKPHSIHNIYHISIPYKRTFHILRGITKHPDEIEGGVRDDSGLSYVSFYRLLNSLLITFITFASHSMPSSKGMRKKRR